MNAMALSHLCEAITVLERSGSGDPVIEHLAYDSRDVRPGSMFFALPGIHVDGGQFIPDAVAAGAVAVVCEVFPDGPPPPVPVLRVADCRRTMSAAAAHFFGHPSRELTVIGVTGTDGKSTTTWLVDQLLTLQGKESGFISTVMTKRGNTPEKNALRQSTPEAPEIHSYLREMVENGKEFAVVEATSHGLSHRTSRLRDVQFTGAVFTNITHEHLEFHGTFEQYRSDKAELFRALDTCHPLDTQRQADGAGGREPFAVINQDDPNSRYFAEATSQRVLFYSTTRGTEHVSGDASAIAHSPPDLCADDIDVLPAGIHCTVHWHGAHRTMEIPLVGRFNVENTLAAVLATAQALHRSPLDILESVPQLKPLTGRMHVVRRDLSWTPIVDYAHTPGSFEKIFPMMREDTPGRLVVVFGSAGERDRAKRAMQGALAARWADVIVLTNEDPRGEEPERILEEIAAGVEQESGSFHRGSDLFLIPDRRTAIRTAVALAQEGDTLLFLGKGHEASIIHANHIEPWDEARVVLEETDRLLKTDLRQKNPSQKGNHT